MAKRKKNRTRKKPLAKGMREPNPAPAGTTMVMPRIARRHLVLAVVAAALCIAVLAIAYLLASQPQERTASTPPPAGKLAAEFVGTQACGGCHASELKAWTGSHHQLAMQEANASTV